ncbi:F-box protein [Actinidia chinensis var. chinensis]|uniref:F-box protein n=1 Tax=Actinidia chinensis var. chinensis TaxID=1590841 RepID=A0A2R6RB47_ACTCC|nr:F-box protein [Actinidia chinensis var. chinensis]
MPDFPIDVIVDILSRLPVKTLLRFRCVSKPWCALIDGRDFIKSHLQRSITTKNHLSLIVRDCYLYSVDFDSLDNAVELDHPLKCDDFGTEVLGSCDGLVCLYNGEDNVAIWNPSTRRYQKLPETEIEFPDYFTSCQCIIYGFGYDPITDDYKVVRLIQFYGEDVWDSFDSEVKVYSSRSNSWRRIKDFPYYLRYKRAYGVLVGSSLHWVVTRKLESNTANLVAAFDLGTEDYRLVTQPDFLNKDFHLKVGELDGCLCMICNFCEVQVDVWVMKDDRVKDSWSKLFSISQPGVIRSFDFVTPLAYSKSGREVLMVQDNKKLIWYDLELKKVKNINIRGIPDYFETEICVESLVQLTRGGEMYGKKQDRKGKKKKKPKKNGKKRDDFLSEGFKLVL